MTTFVELIPIDDEPQFSVFCPPIFDELFNGMVDKDNEYFGDNGDRLEYDDIRELFSCIKRSPYQVFYDANDKPDCVCINSYAPFIVEGELLPLIPIRYEPISTSSYLWSTDNSISCINIKCASIDGAVNLYNDLLCSHNNSQ